MTKHHRLEGLSIVLPAFNEESNVRQAVMRARAAGERFADAVDVIVVDDGSTDHTATEAVNAGAQVVSHGCNRGYGAALRSGFAAARRPWIFQMDCDNQFDPEEIAKLIPLVEEADIIIGIRAERADARRRVWAGYAWNWLCRLAFGFIVRDVDCGFKLLKRGAVEHLDLTSNGAGISLELCVAGRAAGLGIREVEVAHRPRTAGAETGLRLHVVIRGLYELYRLRRRYGRRRRSVRPSQRSVSVGAHR
jgi:glycosyltransferase involved in cell wall biosynthesis